ncbi:integrase domain-containing protein [Raoultella ornithinolytica]|uniref:integrase domain-containing protein n=1 Tax=Enterobacteriaceae TaxID=543 RepID=UPI00064B7FB7|nr:MULTISPECIES: integrase domain-containing protein [Enterobacteriaceae]HCI6569283.1 tyrosine-type recombinase/integrase [Klebsiella variicola subsp. variicola]HDS5361435.1 tyrosine-type recombinase/integrase [Klebsiella variicola]HDX8843143.1 tyrosine-type recombinase/integrase [Klebsiella oxytoca]KLR46565.1 integrase [Enterobacter hormaechei subsp. steigerwaltii]MDV0591588.1 integrase domain-containing protein [Raoultella ornithinolytica]
MARLTKPLTDTEIKNARPKEAEYTLHDGDGLQLLIKTSGKKVWQYRYSRPFNQKRAKLTFGPYPEVTLADARQRRHEARTLLTKDIDPYTHQQSLRRQALEAQSNTFKIVAGQWLQLKKSSITADYASDIWRSLEKDIFPAIGEISITDIKAPTLVQAIQPVQSRGALETVRRLCQRINEVMIYAMNAGLIDTAPSINISKAFEKPQKKHMPSIRPDQLPQLMQTMRLASIELPTRCLFMWQLLTLTRPSEASDTRWQEIDLDAREWRIPAERMKMKRAHIVPLSVQALAVLELMRPLSSQREYVFSSRIKPLQPMSSQTVNAALKRAGLGGILVSHGMRSIASTALNEQGFPPDVIEAALAHVDKNEVRRAYNRSDYLEQRRPMMQWWADFVKAADNGSLLEGGIRGLKAIN